MAYLEISWAGPRSLAKKKRLQTFHTVDERKEKRSLLSQGQYRAPFSTREPEEVKSDEQEVDIFVLSVSLQLLQKVRAALSVLKGAGHALCSLHTCTL